MKNSSIVYAPFFWKFTENRRHIYSTESLISYSLRSLFRYRTAAVALKTNLNNVSVVVVVFFPSDDSVFFLRSFDLPSADRPSPSRTHLTESGEESISTWWWCALPCLRPISFFLQYFFCFAECFRVNCFRLHFDLVLAFVRCIVVAVVQDLLQFSFFELERVLKGRTHYSNTLVHRTVVMCNVRVWLSRARLIIASLLFWFISMKIFLLMNSIDNGSLCLTVEQTRFAWWFWYPSRPMITNKKAATAT